MLALGDEAEAHLAQLDHVAGGEDRVLHLLAVDPHAVGAAQIGDSDLVAIDVHLRVLAGDAAVVHPHVEVFGATDAHAVAHRELGARRGRREHDDPRGRGRLGVGAAVGGGPGRLALHRDDVVTDGDLVAGLQLGLFTDALTVDLHSIVGGEVFDGVLAVRLAETGVPTGDVPLRQTDRVALLAPDRDLVAHERDDRRFSFVVRNDELEHPCRRPESLRVCAGITHELRNPRGWYPHALWCQCGVGPTGPME